MIISTQKFRNSSPLISSWATKMESTMRLQELLTAKQTRAVNTVPAVSHKHVQSVLQTFTNLDVVKLKALLQQGGFSVLRRFCSGSSSSFVVNNTSLMSACCARCSVTCTNTVTRCTTPPKSLRTLAERFSPAAALCHLEAERDLRINM